MIYDMFKTVCSLTLDDLEAKNKICVLVFQGYEIPDCTYIPNSHFLKYLMDLLSCSLVLTIADESFRQLEILPGYPDYFSVQLKPNETYMEYDFVLTDLSQLLLIHSIHFQYID